MYEYFIVAHTYAMPFFSESIEQYIMANDADKALLIFLSKHNNVYAANVYNSADDYHKDIEALIKWRSTKAQKDWER